MSPVPRKPEREEVSAHVARRYLEEYGEEAVARLEEAAVLCEAQDDLHGRNRLLRLRDEILLHQFVRP